MVDYSLSEHDISLIINPQLAETGQKTKYLIKPYAFLNQFSRITDLMDRYDAIIILYFTAQNYGHFTCLTKSSTPEYYDYMERQYGVRPTKYVLTFFDSLGLLVDKELKFVPPDIQKIHDEEYPHLRELLKNCDHYVEWNEWQVQKDVSGVATCGRWCAQRVVDRNVPLKPWVDQFLHKKDNADSIIVRMTSKYLGYNAFGGSGGASKPKPKVSRKPKATPKPKTKKRLPSLSRGIVVPRWGSPSFVNENVINILGTKAPERKRKVRGTKPIRYQNEKLNYRNPTVKRERGPLQSVKQDRQFPPPVSLSSQVSYVNNGDTAAANALAALTNQVTEIVKSTRNLRTRNVADRDFLNQAEDTHINDVLERREAEGRRLGSERARGQAAGVRLEYARRPTRSRRVGVMPLESELRQGATDADLDTTIYDPDDHAGDSYQRREQPPAQPYQSNGIAVMPTTVVEPQVMTRITQAAIPRNLAVHAVDEPFRQSGDRFQRVVHFVPQSQMRGVARPRVEQVEQEVATSPFPREPIPSRTHVVASTRESGDRVYPLNPFVSLSQPERRPSRPFSPYGAAWDDDEGELEREEEEHFVHRRVKVPKADRTATHTLTATATRADTGHLGDDGEEEGTEYEEEGEGDEDEDEDEDDGVTNQSSEARWVRTMEAHGNSAQVSALNALRPAQRRALRRSGEDPDAYATDAERTSTNYD